MVETIESFVAKLQADGVQAGQQAADKLREDAQKQADQIIAQARKDAEKILADAGAAAQKTLSRSQTELELATRDAVLRLKDALGRAIHAILAHGAKHQLEDDQFIGKILHELILLYAKADLEGDGGIRINVPPEMMEKIAHWALHEIAAEAAGDKHVPIDLKGTLAAAGLAHCTWSAPGRVNTVWLWARLRRGRSRTKSLLFQS